MNQECLHKIVSTVANAKGPVTEEYIQANADLDFSDQQFTSHHEKIEQLVDAEVLKDVSDPTNPPNENEYVLNTSHRTVERDGTTIKTERDGSVRITDEENDQLTIQPTSTDIESYQLTTWWEDETSPTKNVADTHIHLPETRLLENTKTHSEQNIGQTPMIIADELIESAPNVICELIDPAPISSQLIGGTAHLTVLSSEHESGFNVTVTRSHNRLSSPLQSKITLPQIDPVKETEQFHKVVDESRMFNAVEREPNTPSNNRNQISIENIVEQLSCESCDNSTSSENQHDLIVEYFNTRLDADTMRDVMSKEQLKKMISRTETGNIQETIVRVDCTHCTKTTYNSESKELVVN